MITKSSKSGSGNSYFYVYIEMLFPLLLFMNKKGRKIAVLNVESAREYSAFAEDPATFGIRPQLR